jgi:hypothetical protein
VKHLKESWYCFSPELLVDLLTHWHTLTVARHLPIRVVFAVKNHQTKVKAVQVGATGVLYL